MSMCIRQQLRGFRILRRGYSIKLPTPHLAFNPSGLCKFHNTSLYKTDGVYPALTEMRVKTPWIEALRKQRQASSNVGKESIMPTTLSDRDMTPKKMSESYYKVVSLSSNQCFLSY